MYRCGQIDENRLVGLIRCIDGQIDENQLSEMIRWIDVNRSMRIGLSNRLDGELPPRRQYVLYGYSGLHLLCLRVPYAVEPPLRLCVLCGSSGSSLAATPRVVLLRLHADLMATSTYALDFS